MPKQRLVRDHSAASADIFTQPHWLGQRIDPSRQDIVFDKDFSYRPARTLEDQHAAWRLRYHIYCEDSGFLPKEQAIPGLEQDVYDPHSHQSLLLHHSSGFLAGTVRLILPDATQEAMALPALTQAPSLRAHCAAWRAQGLVGEVSRFSIDPRFRQRAGQIYAAQGQKPAMLATMLLGLVLAALDMARTHHIEHLVALVDPVLVRLLHRIGVYWQPVGATVYYHGVRQPSHICCTQAIALLAERYPAAVHHLDDLVRGGKVMTA